MESIYIEIELYEEDGKRYVFLSHDGSSGCKYEINDASDLKEIVGDYVANAYYDESDRQEFLAGLIGEDEDDEGDEE